ENPAVAKEIEAKIRAAAATVSAGLEEPAEEETEPES
ncbi:MAG: DNA recombination/repair protein RecA, partial [Chloroflexi bacterium]|nr:DNA recombination/repair protein RecA [Chloroflexota bacterium]